MASQVRAAAQTSPVVADWEGVCMVPGARRRSTLRECLVALTVLALTLCVSAGVQAAPEDEKAAAWRIGSKTGLHTRGLSSLRIHPKNPGLFWAYVHGMGVAQSRDGGKTWKAMMKGIGSEGLPGPRSEVRITLDPAKPKIAYAVIDGRIYKTEDSGESWKEISSGALAVLSWDRLNSTHLCWQVEVDQKKPAHLLVGIRNDGHHNGGLYESNKGGLNWVELAGTQKPDSKLGHDTRFVRIDPKTEKNVTVAGSTSVWWSDDRGRTFKRNDPGEEGLHDIRWMSEFAGKNRALYIADARGIWRSKDAGKKWDKKPVTTGDALYVIPDPHNKKRVFAIFRDRGLLASDDSKLKDWKPMGGAWSADAKKDGDKDAAGGYRKAFPGEIVFHPRDKKTIYLTSPVTGLHISTDAGETFQSVEPPDGAKKETLIPGIVPPLTAIGVHPAKGGIHVAIDDHGRAYQSGDRCETWTPVGPVGMAVHKLQPGGRANEWYATGAQLLRTKDDGVSWETVYAPEDPEERVVALHRSTTSGAGDGTLRILLERTAKVLISTDDGASWAETKKAPALPSDQTWAADLAVNPAKGDHLIIATRSVRRGPGVRHDNGGVFETWDGGGKWSEITDNLRPDKNDDPDTRKAKAHWNRGRMIVMDPPSGLLIYGADGRGILARKPIDPKGEKPKETPGWVDITPPEPARPHVAAFAHTMTPDKTDTQLVLQVRGSDAATGLYGAKGRTLRALYDHAIAEEKPEAQPAWAAWPSPGQKLTLSSLAADEQLPGRLVGTDRRGDAGVLIFEVPGSTPDGAKKDEPKDEPKQPEEGSGTGAGARPPEGMRAFTASADKSVRIWQVDKNEAGASLSGHEGHVNCIVLTPDEQYVVTGGLDQTVRIWNASNGKLLATVQTEAAVNALVADDDSKFVYAALEETNGVLQIDISTQATKLLAGHGGAVTSVAATDDVNRLYSASRDETIRVWDTAAGSEVLQIPLGTAVEALAVAPDGSRIYAAGADKTVRAFEASGKEIAKIGPIAASIRALQISPDGSTLYAAANVGVQALATADLQGKVLHKAGGAGVTCVAVSADHKWVFAGDSQGRMWVWAVGAADAFSAAAKGHGMAINGIAVTPDETSDGGDAPADKPKSDEPKKDDPGKSDGADKPGDVPGGADKPKDGPGAKDTSPSK